MDVSQKLTGLFNGTFLYYIIEPQKTMEYWDILQHDGLLKYYALKKYTHTHTP